MTRNFDRPSPLAILVIAATVAVLGFAPSGSAPPHASLLAADPAAARHETLSLRGRVVWLAEALERRFGISTDSDAAHWQVALDGEDGQIYPIAKDARGRGFMLDERIRDIDLELLVRRYKGSPVVQVIGIHSIKEDGKYELDYWCDVCAIPMYELKPCECCQEPIRIRERKVDEGERPPIKNPKSKIKNP